MRFAWVVVQKLSSCREMSLRSEIIFMVKITMQTGRTAQEQMPACHTQALDSHSQHWGGLRSMGSCRG